MARNGEMSRGGPPALADGPDRVILRGPSGHRRDSTIEILKENPMLDARITTGASALIPPWAGYARSSYGVSSGC